MDDATEHERSHPAAMLTVFLTVLIGGAAVLHVLMRLFDFGTAAATASLAALPVFAVYYAVTSIERK